MKFAISAVVLAIVSLLLGFVVHGMLLAPDYHALPNLFRTEADGGAHMPFMLLAHLCIGIGFTWIYLKGREAKPFIAQGVRFGLAVAVLTTIPMYLIYFAVQPMPGGTAPGPGGAPGLSPGSASVGPNPDQAGLRRVMLALQAGAH